MRAQNTNILARALSGSSGLFAPPRSSARDWLQGRLAILSLVGALLLLLSLPTSVTFTVARDVISPGGEGTYLHASHVGGVSKTPYSEIHRMRGIMESEQGFDHALGIVATLSDVFGLHIEEANLAPTPILVEPPPKEDSFPHELLSRPPPLR